MKKRNYDLMLQEVLDTENDVWESLRRLTCKYEGVLPHELFSAIMKARVAITNVAAVLVTLSKED